MGARVVIVVMTLCAPAAFMACGSSHAVVPGVADGGKAGPAEATDAETADGGGTVPTGDEGGVAAACNDFLAASLACSALPSAVDAHDGPRFRQFCENQLSLPGMTMTVAALESCARATKADCNAQCNLPFAGTLPAGAPCNADFYQCQSGGCAATRLPDGGYATCGTCAASIPIGQPCNVTGPDSCEPGSYCGTSDTCVAYGSAGSACSSSLPCEANDFFCSSSGQCTAKLALGAACAADIDCADALPCVSGTCAAQAPAGSPCTPSGYASPCKGGLTCNPVTSTCVAPTVQPGGACGANGLLCQVGSCSTTGLCPTIIPDGQPCPVDDTETCDVNADCLTGVCTIPGGTVCQ